ncbi:unnamed protein product [Blepharisma stoltei]|uniref:Uncharacterized protein n=1 Tax=Blepharisma stoltei TaxID=1481888 RepID=A0AAU9K1B6_9CILI|nr:unnamed protein product [Blepharisma stoltei]
MRIAQKLIIHRIYEGRKQIFEKSWKFRLIIKEEMHNFLVVLRCCNSRHDWSKSKLKIIVISSSLIIYLTFICSYIFFWNLKIYIKAEQVLYITLSSHKVITKISCWAQTEHFIGLRPLSDYWGLLSHQILSYGIEFEKETALLAQLLYNCHMQWLYMDFLPKLQLDLI